MSARKRLVLVTHEPPFPPTHGGRVDQWNRYSLLKSMGWEIAIVTWVRNSVHADVPALRKALAQVFPKTILLKGGRTVGNVLWRLAALPVHSHYVSNLYVPRGMREQLTAELREFDPDALLLDHLYAGLLAKNLASQLGKPLLYRSNNVEHLFAAAMSASAAKMSQKLIYLSGSFNLRDFEFAMHRDASWTFDCSADDCEFWRSKGFTRNSWAPPLVDTARLSKAPRRPWSTRAYDAVFLGNLFSAANLDAIRWFIEEVMPFVTARMPAMKILIAGSRPPNEFLAAARAHPQITVLADPEDAAEVRAQGRVLINPVLRGSGINVKLVEMLFSDSPIVTTPVGARGFDKQTRTLFGVAQEADDFATEILNALQRGPLPDTDRAPARQRFGQKGAEEFSNQLQSLL